MANNNDHQATGSILDVINEKATNLEHMIGNKNSKDTLKETIWANAKREKALREATVTIKHDSTHDHSKIVEIIETKWVEPNNQLHGTYWQDKEFTYCQFTSLEAKNRFLDNIRLDSGMGLQDLVLKPNKDGMHFTRKPVRIEINNVRGNIKADRIQKTLQTELKGIGNLTEFKEGKANPVTRSRNILFRVDSKAFKHLFDNMGGSIPYVNLETGTKIRLVLRVNSRPWQCKDCFVIGNHQCDGKTCIQCGRKGHDGKDCRSKTRRCSNCRRDGHRAKDANCPTFVNALVNELKKMDVPIEFYEDEELRNTLCRAVQMK